MRKIKMVTPSSKCNDCPVVLPCEKCVREKQNTEMTRVKLYLSPKHPRDGYRNLLIAVESTDEIVSMVQFVQKLPHYDKEKK